MHTPLGLTPAQRWFLSAALSPASQGDTTSWWKGGLCTPATVRIGSHQEPGCHYSWPRGSVQRSDRTRPLTSTFPQAAVTYSSSVMASWQLSHTLTSNSKPISGIGERLELHLPQTAFPHLRQWCWRERRRAHCACAPPRARNAQAWPTAPGADAQREAPSALEARARGSSVWILFTQNEDCLGSKSDCATAPSAPFPSLGPFQLSSMWTSSSRVILRVLGVHRVYGGSATSRDHTVPWRTGMKPGSIHCLHVGRAQAGGLAFDFPGGQTKPNHRIRLKMLL